MKNLDLYVEAVMQQSANPRGASVTWIKWRFGTTKEEAWEIRKAVREEASRRAMEALYLEVKRNAQQEKVVHPDVQKVMRELGVNELEATLWLQMRIA